MKKVSLVVTVLMCTLSLTSLGEVSQKSPTQEQPNLFFKTKKMPDYCQLDSRLPNRGKQYCGPAAVSNALVWLAFNGHRALLPDDADLAQAQFCVIQTLGSESYMKTALYAGTNPIDVMIGLDKYIRSCGYEPVIEWKGYREGGKYARGPIPELEWMTGGFDKEYNAILEIGWYNYCECCNSFKRNGGHYVTLAGVKLDGKAPQLIVHNPSIGGGTTPRPQVCTLSVINKGTLAPWGEYKRRSAQGYYTIEGITMPSNAKIAILEGVVKFTVRDPRQEMAEQKSATPVMGLTGF